MLSAFDEEVAASIARSAKAVNDTEAAKSEPSLFGEEARLAQLATTEGPGAVNSDKAREEVVNLSGRDEYESLHKGNPNYTPVRGQVDISSPSTVEYVDDGHVLIHIPRIAQQIKASQECDAAKKRDELEEMIRTGTPSGAREPVTLEGRYIDTEEPIGTVEVDGGPKVAMYNFSMSMKDDESFKQLEQKSERGAQFDALLAAAEKLLMWLGIDPEESGVLETPRRYIDFLSEFAQPVDLVAMLKQFEYEDSGSTGAMVVQTGIPFRGLCEHHLLPFMGTASIGYIPNKKVVGLSKLTRMTQAAGTLRPSTQETITNKIADALHHGIEPLGVMVVTSALHTCMSVRGINAPGVSTKVSAIRGAYIHSQAARQEFLSLVS